MGCKSYFFPFPAVEWDSPSLRKSSLLLGFPVLFMVELLQASGISLTSLLSVKLTLLEADLTRASIRTCILAIYRVLMACS